MLCDAHVKATFDQCCIMLLPCGASVYDDAEWRWFTLRYLCARMIFADSREMST